MQCHIRENSEHAAYKRISEITPIFKEILREKGGEGLEIERERERLINDKAEK